MAYACTYRNKFSNWVYLKTRYTPFDNSVYITLPQTEEKSQDCIGSEVDILRNNQDLNRKTVSDIIRRWGLYLDRRSTGSIQLVDA